MTRIQFTKMHGIGNDYVYVDCFERSLSDPARVAERVSLRNTGIGSDGLILIYPSDIADCRMEMYNADGSRGKMCGNGIRCVGKFVFEHGRVPKSRLTVETDVGVKELDLEVSSGIVTSVTVDMGEPILEGSQIPVAAHGHIIDVPFDNDRLRGTAFEWVPITCVSMGNPHCVVFVDDVESLDLAEIGPSFESHAFFPERVNTEFVHVVSRAVLRMRVWERGSGETAACGTGACAAVVAGALTKRSDAVATVRLNGGDLRIEWRQADGHVFMTGGAEEVFRGEIDI